MTPEQKKEIDEMPYEEMLRQWRFSPIDSSGFQGERGAYYAKVMGEKRTKVGDAAHVAASKRIGW